jgi:hypothetical protein
MNDLDETKDETEDETKANLMCTVKMYDGPPYGECKIEQGYKVRGDEQEVLKEIVAAMKRWRNKA